MRKDGAAFLERALYLRKYDGQLLRLICEDLESGDALFHKVSLQWDKTPKLSLAILIPEAYRMLDAGELLPHEEIRPGFMGDSDEDLRRAEYDKTGYVPVDPPPAPQADPPANLSEDASDAAQKECPSTDPCRLIRMRDDAWSLIKPLVDTPQALRATFHPRTSTAMIRQRAEALKVPFLKIQRLVHKFAWFGLDKNALLPLDALKGPSRDVPTDSGVKRGHPNAATLIGLPSDLEGRNVTQRDIAIFIRALKQYWTRDDESLEATYKLMCHNMFVAKTRVHGELITVQQRRVPTLWQFQYHARVLLAELGLGKDKDGLVDAMKTATSPGRDTDIGKSVGDVFDIDATEFNRELVADFIIKGRTVNVGKPIVVLVFDRRSKKVVGWHVYIGRENWKQGYRLALLCALSSKDERLAYLGIEANPGYKLWEVNIKPRYIYGDNGPMVSEDSMDALERLDIGLYPAPPEFPCWKPAVEGGLGNFQSKHATLSGGYRRTRRTRDRKRRRYAKLLADKTLYQFEQLLVLQIIEYNSRVDMEQLLDAEQKKAGIEAGPDAVFAHGVSRRGGIRHRVCSRNDARRALMKHYRRRRLTRFGVRANRAYYSCPALEKAFAQGTRRVDFVAHPTNPTQVSWLPDDGQEIPLERWKAGNDQYGTQSVLDIELYHLHQNAETIRAERRGRLRALTKRQTDLLLKREGGPPKKQRNRPTPEIDEVRRLQAEIHRLTNPADLATAEHLAPSTFLATPAPVSRSDLADPGLGASAPTPPTIAGPSVPFAPHRPDRKVHTDSSADRWEQGD